MFTPMGAAETTALSGVNAAAFDPARQALLNQTLSGGFLPGQSGSNPFLDAAIKAAQEPTRLALESAVQRRIPGMFVQGGQTLGGGGSSPYQRELGLAAFQGGRALGDIATTMSSAAYEAERARQQGAISLGQQDVQAMLANLQAQGIPRMIQDQGIDRAIATGQQGIQNLLQAFNIAQGYPLQTMGQFGTSQGTQTSTSTGTGTGAGTNIMAGLFGNQGAIPYLFGNPSAQAVRTAGT